jgi:predicted nucleotidyltransferase
MVSSKQAVLKTLQYADLFNYPLKEEEIKKYLIKKVGDKNLKEILKSAKEINNLSDFYFLKGRKNLVEARKKREKESLIKIEKAKKISLLLSKIPSVLLIAISGSVAVKNAKKEDDIDLFIVTEEKTLWTTRFLMILILKILGQYRSRGEKNVKDKFCLNMFLTDKNLQFSKNKRNIYTAREICQILPLFQRDKTYFKILFKNIWVKDFLPNAFSFLKKEHQNLANNHKNSSGKRFLEIIDFPLKMVQLMKIKRNQTNETVSHNLLAFHPNDFMIKVLKKYNNGLE